MHWYDGSIEEAVTLSKQKNAIFVVFVEGDNELSSEMAATIDDASVAKRLADPTNFLAVKLKSGSVNYTHFASIYQFVPVPSLFFISRNGTPLEVVCAGVQPNNLATRIDRIVAEYRKEKQAGVQPSTSAQNIRQQTASLLQAESTPTPLEQAPASTKVHAETPASSVEPETSSGPAAKIQKTEHHEITKSGKEYDVVCDGDVCVRIPKVKPDDPGPSQPASVAPSAPQESTSLASESVASLEEKMEKAKELIEARRREKAEEEKELERQKELERRQIGQGVAELKQWQAEQELKQLQEERKREKMENDMARQRILEQIAQDRAERRAKDTPAPQAQPSQAPPATSGDAGTRARIQFKLPDGSSHTAHFDADGTLADVQRYVADNLQLPTSSFSLWTAFPRRELTETDETLRRLELAPSAALLVLPRRTATTVASPSSFSALITFFTQFFALYILEPTQQAFTWLRQRLFPPTRNPSEPSPPRVPPVSPPGAPGVRRRGNIHRLGGERPGDDDNNTWNGNSTQQM